MCIQICICMYVHTCDVCMHVCVCMTEVTDYDERAYVAASLKAREQERERESGRVVGV